MVVSSSESGEGITAIHPQQQQQGELGEKGTKKRGGFFSRSKK
jgi:hypothetical protein